MKQIKLITLNEFDPDDKDRFPFDEIKNIGINQMPCMIDEKILTRIVEVYQEDGEKELIRMIDRGQISQEDAESVLGDKYVSVATQVPVVEYDEQHYAEAS